jgi:hypothetical protein
MGEQDRGQALALELVGDGERHLGTPRIHRDVDRVRDDTPALAGRRNEPEATGVVDLERPPAALRRSPPVEKKRNQRESRERPSRNASRPSRSHARTGRTRIVDPSRRTTSASSSQG